MIRSRLRRPTSKSMTATLWPRRARPQAIEALLVVLPTPPLPEVTTMISVKFGSSGTGCARASVGGGSDGRAWNGDCRLPRRRRGTATGCPFSGSLCALRRNVELAVLQPDLHRLAAQRRRQVFHHLVMPGDGDQLGMELIAEDPCLLVALGAGQCAAPQRPVDMHRAIGDDLGAGADPGQYGQVAVVGVDLLARTHQRRVDHPRTACRRGGCGGGCGAGGGLRCGWSRRG